VSHKRLETQNWHSPEQLEVDRVTDQILPPPWAEHALFPTNFTWLSLRCHAPREMGETQKTILSFDSTSLGIYSLPFPQKSTHFSPRKIYGLFKIDFAQSHEREC
jgi:hypothetical protein